MNRGLLLIDGNNIGNASNAAQRLTVGEQPTQAIYGFLRTLRPLVQTYPMLTPIVLWDGAPWRHMAFPEYKAARNKEPVTKSEIQAAQAKAEFKSQVPYIRESLRYLGVRQMLALNYEADDLAGVLIERFAPSDRKIIMVSADKDWVQLLRPNMLWVDPIRDYRLSAAALPKRLGYSPAKKKIVVGKAEEIEGFIGVPSPRAWLEIKALMGDISDSIPGVGGIGAKGAAEFVNQYSSVATFLNQVIDKTIDIDKLPKQLRDFAIEDAKQDIFARNIRLMDLTSKERPAWVSPTIDPGEFDETQFEAFCNRLSFNSIARNTREWMAPFAPKAKEELAA